MIELERLFKSFGFAFKGLEHAYRYDQNLRVHFFIAVVVILAGILVGLNSLEMAILAVTIVIVMSAEMVNSALERMVDLITKEHREDAKIAKDVAAGMVFITAAGSVAVGILIFLPHIIQL